MKNIEFGSEKKQLSQVILGLMRIADKSAGQVRALLGTALDAEINTIDLADIYGDGACEQIVGQVFSAEPSLRDRFFVQSKCGINKKGRRLADGSAMTYFDFSRDHILKSADGILQRLKTDHIDSFLLHRPDALMEPQEICEAFTRLHESGKVLHFGVSNQNPHQMELIASALPFPLATNQIQMSCAFAPTIDAGFNVNMQIPASVMRDGGILEYCRRHDMVVQAWSVMQYGYFEGAFIGSPLYPGLNAALEAVANEVGGQATPASVAVAWLLRLPGKMQAVIGTTTPARVVEAARAADIVLTREQWYEIYQAAGRTLP